MSEPMIVLWVLVIISVRLGLPLMLTFGGAFLLHRLYARLDPDYARL